MTTTDRLSWKDVQEVIRSRILDSTYGPGSKLPRDEDIAAELGCARSTVQRAMHELASDGIVERRRKGGTRVLSHPVTRATFDIPITRREVEASGRTYGYQLVGRQIGMTPRTVTAAFGLSEPREMLRVQALHLANQRPHSFEDRWICLETVPEIQEVDLSTESANEWLVLNRPYSRCELRFYARNADSRHVSLLDTRDGDALFVMERTTWIGADPITSVTAVTHPGYELRTST
jgi:GntR family histidine utilization transcriptional repressor